MYRLSVSAARTPPLPQHFLPVRSPRGQAGGRDCRGRRRRGVRGRVHPTYRVPLRLHTLTIVALPALDPPLRSTCSRSASPPLLTGRVVVPSTRRDAGCEYGIYG